jgi:dihydropteroate synthase
MGMAGTLLSELGELFGGQAVALGIAHGVDLIRVHDVEEMARVAKLTDVITRGEY